MSWKSILSNFLTTRIGRSLADGLFRQRARRRLVQLDSINPARGQYRAFQGLIHRGASTQFGMDHNFHRIREEADFRRLVPLRSPAQIWQQYVLPCMPSIHNAVWPGTVSFLATCDSPMQEVNAPLTVTADLGSAHRDALLTTLALIQNTRPHARMLSGSLLLLGGGVALTPVQGRAARYSMETLVQTQLPGLLRPFAVLAPHSGSASLQIVAEHILDQSITCVLTSAARLIRLWGYLQKLSNAKSLLDLWPHLTAIVYARTSNESERGRIRKILGDHPRASSVVLLEGVIHPQGAVAIEDPRYGRLRMLSQHGIYFELVSLDQLERANPERIGLAEAKPGVPYAVAMSSPAGVWACLLDLTITLESINPPLLSRVEMGAPVPQPSLILPLRSHAASGVNPPVSHRRSDDMSARHPERLSRNPWSRRADQK